MYVAVCSDEIIEITLLHIHVSQLRVCRMSVQNVKVRVPGNFHITVLIYSIILRTTCLVETVQRLQRIAAMAKAVAMEHACCHLILWSNSYVDEVQIF
jgi:hypothetical protein